jgi:predicted nucleic acid-binding protein
MPTRGSGPQTLVNTSVAVALVVADHEHHLAKIGAIGDRRLGLAAHARLGIHALVASTAIEHGLKLANRDQRALVTYRALRVDVEMLADQ